MLARLLSYELEARQFKIDKNIQSLGKCGVLFEGAAATGKSELALYALHRLGYQKLNESEVKEEKREAKYFLHLSAGNMNRFEHLLLHAFHQRFIVVIDEIDLNTAAEKLLNHFIVRGRLGRDQSTTSGIFYYWFKKSPKLRGAPSSIQSTD